MILIRKYMDEECLSIKDMADLCDISKTAVWHYIQGKRSPNRKNAAKIAKATKNRISMRDLGYL